MKRTPITKLHKMGVTNAFCKHCGRGYPIKFIRGHEKTCKFRN